MIFSFFIIIKDERIQEIIKEIRGSQIKRIERMGLIYNIEEKQIVDTNFLLHRIVIYIYK